MTVNGREDIEAGPGLTLDPARTHAEPSLPARLAAMARRGRNLACPHMPPQVREFVREAVDILDIAAEKYAIISGLYAARRLLAIAARMERKEVKPLRSRADIEAKLAELERQHAAVDNDADTARGMNAHFADRIAGLRFTLGEETL